MYEYELKDSEKQKPKKIEEIEPNSLFKASNLFNQVHACTQTNLIGIG